MGWQSSGHTALWPIHQLRSTVFYRIKSSKFVEYHPFLYHFISFIYVGEVVGTSEAAKVVSGGMLGYPVDGYPQLWNLWGRQWCVMRGFGLVWSGSAHVGALGSIEVVSSLWAAGLLDQWCWDAVGIRDDLSDTYW